MRMAAFEPTSWDPAVGRREHGPDHSHDEVRTSAAMAANTTVR